MARPFSLNKNCLAVEKGTKGKPKPCWRVRHEPLEVDWTILARIRHGVPGIRDPSIVRLRPFDPGGLGSASKEKPTSWFRRPSIKPFLGPPKAAIVSRHQGKGKSCVALVRKADIIKLTKDSSVNPRSKRYDSNLKF